MQYSFLAEDSILGWKSKPNDTISIPLEGKRAKIVINENGFRGITAAKSWGCYSIWGDEQVFGWPASGRMLFTELLNRNAGSGDLSFFNYGIPGYSPLQQLVLYKKLRNKLKCDTLVWVFNSRNDIQDLERNSFYYFFNRPFASVQDRQIKQTDPAWGFREKFRKALIYNLPESHNLNYLKNDFLKPKPEDWSNPNDFFDRISPNGDSSLPKLLELIVRDFSREIREDNRVLIVALLPSPAMIERKLSGPRDGFSNGEDLVFLNDYFDKLSMRYKFFFIDLSPAFFLEHQAGKILFDEEDGSLTEAGQVLLARCMFMLRQEINKPLGQGNWVRKNRLRV